LDHSPACGAANTAGTNPLFWGFKPTAEYDSWLTVGLVDGTGADLTDEGIDFDAWTDQIQLETTGSVRWIDPNQAPTVGTDGGVTIAQVLAMPSSQQRPPRQLLPQCVNLRPRPRR
jgi:hypothetical protein